MGRPKGSKNKTATANKRAEIQAAAMRVFCHYGYDGATLELIAAAAGASRALVGKYFGSKEQLAKLCIREFIQSFFVTFHKAHQKAGSYHEATGAVASLFALHRSEWRFLIAVLCTPSLADLHAEIVPLYLGKAQAAVNSWPGDLQDPADVPALAWLMTASHFCYVIGGSLPNYENSRGNLLAKYIKPEKIL